MLSPAQIAQREGKLTGSRVAPLMDGNETALMNLWREMVGDPDFVPEDLSGVWPVQLGSCTEGLNLDWAERTLGTLSRRGEVVTHANGWAAATLDAWIDARRCPIECKHVGGRESLETIYARYCAQRHWQMIVTGATECAMSVIMGANEPVIEFLPFDADYGRELWLRAEAFMLCVKTLTPPVAIAPVAAPVKPEKTYDMVGNNQWATEALNWTTTRQARKDNEAAEKVLKGLVPPDAMRCFGYQIEIKRDRAGRLSLKELKQ